MGEWAFALLTCHWFRSQRAPTRILLNVLMPGAAREWMVPGGAHGLQTRWGAACVVLGGFDSLPLPPVSLGHAARGDP